MDVQKLKPYKSFLFCTIADIPVSTVCSDIEELVKKQDGSIITKSKLVLEELEISFFTYKDKKIPPWCNDESIKDIINEIVLAVKKNNHIAIYTSDPSIRDKIRSFIVDTKKEKRKQIYLPATYFTRQIKRRLY